MLPSTVSDNRRVQLQKRDKNQYVLDRLGVQQYMNVFEIKKVTLVICRPHFAYRTQMFDTPKKFMIIPHYRIYPETRYDEEISLFSNSLVGVDVQTTLFRRTFIS